MRLIRFADGFVTAVLALFCVHAARADVNFMTGEYTTRSTDLLFSATLDFSRNYSSLQSSKGWFGTGWSSPFDWKIEASSLGAIRLIRGQEIIEFYGRSSADIDFKDEKVEAIITHQLKTRLIKNDDEARVLRGNLKQNRLLFKLAWDRTFSETRVNLESITSADRHYFPEEGALATASFRQKEWVFELPSRDRLVFDTQGHLVRRQFGATSYEIQWTKGAPTQIRSASRILLIASANGLVSKIESKASSASAPIETIEFRYLDQRLLTDVKANAYQETYRYRELNGNFALTEATHDAITEKLEYTSEKSAPRVSRFWIATRSRTVETRFQYDDSARDSLIFRTTVTFVDSTGKPNHTEKHEYLLTRNDAGELALRTHRLSDGKLEHRTTFDENGRILFEKTPTDRWAYEYDGFGRLTTRLGNRTLTQYRYDEEGRITQIVEIDVANRTLASISENPRGRTAEFFYDENGLLKQLKSSSGLNYKIDIDANGRPIRFSDPGGRRSFEVTYDSKNRVNEILPKGSKPVQIRHLSNGSLEFSQSSKNNSNTRFVFEAFVRAKLAFDSLSSRGGVR